MNSLKIAALVLIAAGILVRRLYLYQGHPRGEDWPDRYGGEGKGDDQRPGLGGCRSNRTRLRVAIRGQQEVLVEARPR